MVEAQPNRYQEDDNELKMAHGCHVLEKFIRRRGTDGAPKELMDAVKGKSVDVARLIRQL